MADPYAERDALPDPERLDPESPLAASAEERELAVIGVADDGLVPPIARVGPEFAAALLTGLGSPEPPRPEPGAPFFLLKTGLVAGPEGRRGAIAVPGDLVLAVLDDALAGRVEWERDPDFDYEVVAGAPSLTGCDRAVIDAFMPRLTYAAADRVYEHAELVEATKRRRHERLEAAGIADPAVHAAMGWPIEPTGTEWKD